MFRLVVPDSNYCSKMALFSECFFMTRIFIIIRKIREFLDNTNEWNEGRVPVE